MSRPPSIQVPGDDSCDCEIADVSFADQSFAPVVAGPVRCGTPFNIPKSPGQLGMSAVRGTLTCEVSGLLKGTTASLTLAEKRSLYDEIERQIDMAFDAYLGTIPGIAGGSECTFVEVCPNTWRGPSTFTLNETIAPPPAITIEFQSCGPIVMVFIPTDVGVNEVND